MIKTRKIKLLVKGDSQERREGKRIVIDTIKECVKLSNEIIRVSLPNQFDLYEMTHGENKLSMKDAREKILEKFSSNSLEMVPYDYSKNRDEIPSMIRTSLAKNIYSTMKNNLYDMIRGEMSIPSYTNAAPIPMNFTSVSSKKGAGAIFKLDE